MTRPATASAIAITPVTVDDLGIAEDVPPEEWVPLGYDPLAASVDHIVPVSAGGSDDPSNLQIAHLCCNLMKHNGDSPTPAYAAARLRWRLQGIPIPARLWQRERKTSFAGVLQRGVAVMDSWPGAANVVR